MTNAAAGGGRAPAASAFLAERYWPGVTVPAAAAATARLAGPGARVIETIVATNDEVCLWVVEASSGDAVDAAFRAADIPLHRISPAVRIDGSRP